MKIDEKEKCNKLSDEDKKNFKFKKGDMIWERLSGRLLQVIEEGEMIITVIDKYKKRESILVSTILETEGNVIMTDPKVTSFFTEYPNKMPRKLLPEVDKNKFAIECKKAKSNLEKEWNDAALLSVNERVEKRREILNRYFVQGFNDVVLTVGSFEGITNSADDMIKKGFSGKGFIIG